MVDHKSINRAILYSLLLLLLTTSGLAEATVRFAIIGDFGNRTSSGAEADVAAMVSGWNPEFVITTGDNRYEGDDYNADVGQFYCEFMADAQSGSFCSGNESAINRFFPSLGNHDYTDGGGVNEYLDYFTLPGTGVANTSGDKRYYDFVKGPVHFFVLDSQAARRTYNNTKVAQQNWLQTQLAASTARWNIVYFHHPAYTSGMSAVSTVMQWPFASWGADVVLAGHDHVYERIATQGITYFINGLGGDILGTFLETPVSGSQVRYSDDHGAMLVNASDTAITFKLFSRTDGLVDTYTLGNWVPTDIALSNTTVPENTNTSGGYLIGTLSSTDEDPKPPETASYSIVGGADSARFSITNGNRLILTDGILDFETKASYVATIRVTDSALNTYSETFTISITNVNEAPTVALSNPTTSLPESTVITSRLRVADIVITDDALGTNTLSLSGADAALFEIVSGALYLKAGTVLDFETNPSLEVTIAVDDTTIPGSPDGTAALVITVTEGNDPPTADFTYSCMDLDCNFTDTSTDGDGTVTGWSWDFGDSSTLGTGINPSHSYAAAGTYTVTLTVTDNGGAADSTMQILNVEEAVVLKGDVNGDGQVNVADLLIASQILLGTRESTVEELEILDVAPLVNGVAAPDGNFNLGDYLVLQRMIME
jgi:tartrate-resistant acid phosphatase type 5